MRPIGQGSTPTIVRFPRTGILRSAAKSQKIRGKPQGPPQKHSSQSATGPLGKTLPPGPVARIIRILAILAAGHGSGPKETFVALASASPPPASFAAGSIDHRYQLAVTVTMTSKIAKPAQLLWTKPDDRIVFRCGMEQPGSSRGS